MSTQEFNLWHAPWTPDQVKALKELQSDNRFHGYTSENGVLLIPTEAGWVENEGGQVVQTWAHAL